MRTWMPEDITKLIKSIRRFPHVWRWSHYLYRNIKIVKSCVCQLAKVYSTSEQDILEVVDMLWKRLIIELDIYFNYLQTKQQKCQWEHFKDFLYIIEDIEQAVLMRSNLGNVLKNYPGLSVDTKNKSDVYNNTAWNHIVDKMSEYSGQSISQRKLSYLWHNFQDVKVKSLDYNIKFSVKNVPQWFHISKTIMTTTVKKLGLDECYLNLKDKSDKKEKSMTIMKTSTKTKGSSQDVYEYKSSESEEEEFNDQMSSQLVDIERQHTLLSIKEAISNGENVNDHDLDRAIFLSLLIKLSASDRQINLSESYFHVWDQLVNEFLSIGFHYTKQQFIDRWCSILIRVKLRVMNFRSFSNENDNNFNNLDWEIYFYFNKIIEKVQLLDFNLDNDDVDKPPMQTNEVQENMKFDGCLAISPQRLTRSTLKRHEESQAPIQNNANSHPLTSTSMKCSSLSGKRKSNRLKQAQEPQPSSSVMSLSSAGQSQTSSELYKLCDYQNMNENDACSSMAMDTVEHNSPSFHLDIDKNNTNCIVYDVPIKIESDSDDNIEFYNVKENDSHSVKTKNSSNNFNIATNHEKTVNNDSDCEIQNLEHESNVQSNNNVTMVDVVECINVIESFKFNDGEKNEKISSNECSHNVSNAPNNSIIGGDDDEDDMPLSSLIKPNMTLEERNKIEELQKLRKMKGVFNYKPILTGEEQLPKNHWLNWYKGFKEDPTIKKIEKVPQPPQSKRKYRKRKNLRIMKKNKKIYNKTHKNCDINTSEQNSLHSSNDSTGKTDSIKSEEEVAANYLEKLLTENDISITPVST